MLSDWLWGSILTEVSAVIYTLGAVYMRRACLQAKAAAKPSGGGGVSRSESRRSAWAPAPLKQIIWHGSLWTGLMLRGLACFIWWRARCSAPDTTVAPLFLSVSFITNMACGPAILQEQYHSKEVLVAFLCIACSSATSFIDKRSMDPWLSLGAWHVGLDHLRNGDSTALLGSAAVWMAAFLVAGAMWLHRCSVYSDLPCRMCLPRSFARQAPAIPILAGLTSGATYFAGDVGFSSTMCLGNNKDKFTEAGLHADGFQYAVIGSLSVLSILFAVEGARWFPCRYFVPAYNTIGFFTATVTRVLLVHHPHNMALSTWISFIVPHIMLLILPFWLSSAPASIKLPAALKQEATAPSTPFHHGTVEPLALCATPLLELSGERGSDKSTTFRELEYEAQSLFLRPPVGQWAYALYTVCANMGLFVPMFALVLVPVVIFAIMLTCSIRFGIFVFVTYNCWAVGGTGLRLAVFSSVGRLRMRLCMDTDYYDLLTRGRRRRGRKVTGGGGRAVVIKVPYDMRRDGSDGDSSSGSEDEEEVVWQEVRHFVVVEGDWDPADERSCEEVRCLLNSLAVSPMAEAQLTIFVAATSDAHAKAVERFDQEFHMCMRAHQSEATQAGAPSPSSTSSAGRSSLPGIIGRNGSAYNRGGTASRWRSVLPLFADGRPAEEPDDAFEGGGPGGAGAFGRLRPPDTGRRRMATRRTLDQLLRHARRCECQEGMVLVTFTTPDAVFSHGFFGALTCAFLTSSDRHMTIWQAPVFPLKDYREQGYAIRHASFFLSHSQLASLSDPISVPLPKSTCSLPLALLHQVDSCWDPELRIQIPAFDWSTGLWTKCWLTTIGRCSVQPIFQPVMRCATQDGRWFPAGSMAVHARGMLELVYFVASLPLLWKGEGSARLHSATTRPRSVGLGRRLKLFLRSLPPVFGIAMAHVYFSSWFVSIVINFIFVLHCLYVVESPYISSGSLLFGVTAQLLGFGVFPLLIMSNTALTSHLPAESLGAGANGLQPRRGHGGAFRRARDLLFFGVWGILAGPVCHFTSFMMHWRLAVKLLGWRTRSEAGDEGLFSSSEDRSPRAGSPTPRVGPKSSSDVSSGGSEAKGRASAARPLWNVSFLLGGGGGRPAAMPTNGGRDALRAEQRLHLKDWFDRFGSELRRAGSAAIAASPVGGSGSIGIIPS